MNTEIEHRQSPTANRVSTEATSALKQICRQVAVPNCARLGIPEDPEAPKTPHELPPEEGHTTPTVTSWAVELALRATKARSAN